METIKEEPLTLPSFKRVKLAQMVFETLRENILSGKLKHGERLPPQDIFAEKFGVSRTVMREALNRLASLGLIESFQGRGTFVSSTDASLLEPVLAALHLDKNLTKELMETRYYLERVIVRLATRRADPEHLTKLSDEIKSMEEHARSKNIEQFAKSDLAFHMELAEAAKNGILRQLLETIRKTMSSFLDNFNRIEGTAERAIEYHKRILEAVTEKDVANAEKEMQGHLLDVANVLRDNFGYDFEF